MRGSPVPLAVPTGGIQANVPPQLVAPNSLAAGSNMFIDIDGRYKPRKGYVQLVAAGPSARIDGGISYFDPSGTEQTVAATESGWWALINNVWTNISNPGFPVTGDANDPARFVAFAQGGSTWALGVNNQNELMAWNSALAQLIPANSATLAIVNIVGNGTTATLTLATAVTNIVVGDSITIAGNTDSAFNVSVIVATVPNGTTLTFASTENATGTGGTVTDTTIQVAPIARDILVLSNRVVVFNTVENGVRFPRRVRWSAFNDFTRWPVLAYDDLLDSNDALVGARKTGRQSCACYGGSSIWTLQANPGGDDSSAFTAEEVFAADGYNGPIGTAAIVVAEGNHYYMGTDGRVYLFNGIQPTATSDPIDPLVINAINFGEGSRVHSIYVPQNRLVAFFWPPTGQVDPFNASILSLDRDVWETPFAYSEAITASWQTTIVDGQTWANDPYLWVTSPYNWEDIPAGNELGCLIGTLAGQVHNFFTSYTDNGVNIPYFASSPLISLDPSKAYQLDRAEIYLSQPAQQEFVTISFQGFGAPLQPAIPIVSILADISVDNWINQMLEPGALNPNNIEFNFLQMTLSSFASGGGLAFVGGNLYLFSEPKGDYGIQ